MPKKFVKLGTLIPFDGNSWKIEFVSKHQRQKLEWAVKALVVQVGCEMTLLLI